MRWKLCRKEEYKLNIAQFYRFFPCLDKIQHIKIPTKSYWVITRFMKVGAVKDTLYRRNWLNCRPCWMKSVTRGLHVITEYCWCWWVSLSKRWKGRTFCIVVNERTFTRVPRNLVKFWKQRTLWWLLCTAWLIGGTRWRNWLRHFSASRKVAGSISYYVIGILHWIKFSGRTTVLGGGGGLTHPVTEGGGGGCAGGEKGGGGGGVFFSFFSFGILLFFYCRRPRGGGGGGGGFDSACNRSE